MFRIFSLEFFHRIFNMPISCPFSYHRVSPFHGASIYSNSFSLQKPSFFTYSPPFTSFPEKSSISFPVIPRCSSSPPFPDHFSEIVSKDEAPLLKALNECAIADTTPFHFPGHKGGSGASANFKTSIGISALAHDLPELPGLDNLFSPEGVILEAQSKAAILFGADKSFFLINGSTVGIQAAVLSVCAPGLPIVIPRNCHQSVISALILSGAIPRYVYPRYAPSWEFSTAVSPSAISTALDEIESEGLRASAVLIVSPTYHGLCSDISTIASICHARNVPLIVDEAHGAHFRFSSRLPPTALEQDADIAIQSIHKVLGSLTQSAMLHVKGARVDPLRVARSLQILQSSSPSYLLLSSLDAACSQMATSTGVQLLNDAVELAQHCRSELRKLKGLDVLNPEVLGSAHAAGYDCLRLTVKTTKWGLSGHELDEILCNDYGVIAELPSLNSLTFAFSAGTTAPHAERLMNAFAALSKRYSTLETPIHTVFGSHGDQASDEGGGYAGNFTEVIYPQNDAMGGSRLTPREAFFAETEIVCKQSAIGRLSAELLCPYPPGIPIVVPGELITKDMVEFLSLVLANGGIVSGASDSSIAFISVIKT